MICFFDFLGGGRDVGPGLWHLTMPCPWDLIPAGLGPLEVRFANSLYRRFGVPGLRPGPPKRFLRPPFVPPLGGNSGAHLGAVRSQHPFFP